VRRTAVVYVYPTPCLQVLIVDEAHRLKNPTSRLFEQLHSIPHEHCVLLTGTPLQNKTEVGTIQPGLIGYWLLHIESNIRVYLSTIRVPNCL
jgi:hypothetical protein